MEAQEEMLVSQAPPPEVSGQALRKGLFSLQSLKVSIDPHITNTNGYLVPPAAQRPKFHPGTQGTLGEG